MFGCYVFNHMHNALALHAATVNSEVCAGYVDLNVKQRSQVDIVKCEAGQGGAGN